MKLVAVIQIVPEKEWCRLDKARRDRMRAEMAAVIISHDQVESRLFDAAPWSSSSSEFVVLEFSALEAYWKLWHALREQTAFRESYLRVDQVSLGYARPIVTGLVDT